MRKFKNLNDYNNVADETVKGALTWNAAFQAVRVNDDTSAKRGLFYLYLGYLNAGESVKVSFDCMSSGDGIQVQFNQYTNSLYQGESRVYSVNVAPSNSFVEKIYTFTAETDAYHVIAVGSPGNFVSEFYLRNLQVSMPYVNSEISQRLYEFVITNGVITTSTNSDLFTLEASATDRRYTLTYGVPFGRLNTLAGVFSAKSAGNPNPRLDCLARSTTRSGCVVQFYDNATGEYLTFAQVTALTGTYYFSLLVTGYDF